MTGARAPPATGSYSTFGIDDGQAGQLVRNAGDDSAMPGGREIDVGMGGVVLVVGSVSHHDQVFVFPAESGQLLNQRAETLRWPASQSPVRPSRWPSQPPTVARSSPARRANPACDW